MTYKKNLIDVALPLEATYLRTAGGEVDKDLPARTRLRTARHRQGLRQARAVMPGIKL